MRVGHGFAHEPHQSQTLGEDGLRSRAVVGDRLPLYELHHHVRAPILGRASVQKVRNSGMIEARQDLPLGLEALQMRSRFALHELQRRQLLKLTVGAGGSVDLAHSAAADQTQDAPGADSGAGGHTGHRSQLA